MDEDPNRCWNALTVHYNGLRTPIEEGLFAQRINSDFLACDSPSDSKLAHEVIATDGSRYDFVICGCNMSDEERSSNGLLTLARLCDERAIPCIIALPRGHSHILVGLKFRFWATRDSLLEPLDMRVCLKGDARFSEGWGNVFKKTFALASESSVFDWDAIVASTAHRRSHKEVNGVEFVSKVYVPKIHPRRKFYTFGEHDDSERIEKSEDPEVIHRSLIRKSVGDNTHRRKITKQNKKVAIKDSLTKRCQSKISRKGIKPKKSTVISDEVSSMPVSSHEDYVCIIQESNLIKKRKRTAFSPVRLRRSKAERKAIKKKKIIDRKLARIKKR